MKRAGISVYVPKPFNPEELQKIILHFLNEDKKEKPEEIQASFTGSSKEFLSAESSTKSRKESFNISQLIQLSRKDPEILRKLIQNSLKSIEKFKEEFIAAANAGSHKNLGDFIHKNNMNLHYIQAEKLPGEIESYKALLEDSKTKQADLKKKKKEVLTEFEETISGLKAVRAEDFSRTPPSKALVLKIQTCSLYRPSLHHCITGIQNDVEKQNSI